MAKTGFEYIDQAFESLGRAVILLNETFQVVQVGRSFEKFVCEGAGILALGKNISDMFFEFNPRVPVDLREIRDKGKILEARRAFLMCPLLGAIPVSLTAAPLCEGDCDEMVGTEAPRFIVALRPSDDWQNAQCVYAQRTSMVAESQAMQQINALIEKLGQTRTSVLITGESGTGKEVVARSIHNANSRKKPFVAVNCAAFPGELLENELFGHSRGAYTGAQSAHAGRFEMAKDGTIFLDEIGDMPLNLQVKLLRVLQERTFCRLGETNERPLNARIIAATNIDLELAIKNGDFREDLYYRLKVVPIYVPPLRERPEDLKSLATFLMEKIGHRIGKALVLSNDTIESLYHYHWPGNVRELENALEYAATFCMGQFVQPEHLPSDLTKKTKDNPSPDKTHKREARKVLTANHVIDGSEEVVFFEEEKEEILNALIRNHWNKMKTAKELGMGRTTLYRKLSEHGIS